jgi:hypothetical protein
MHTVHVRINDAASGQPTAVRIRFTGRDGQYYPPLGRLAEFALEAGIDVGGNLLLEGPGSAGQRAGKRYAYIDGMCEVLLPPGRVFVEVHKGPEYRPLKEELVLSPGKMAIRLAMERSSDLGAEGWRSGDTRCHFITPHAALLEAAAEDLAVVNLLAVDSLSAVRDQGSRVRAIANLLAFSGQVPALEHSGHIVVVNTLNHHPILGTLSLLNCHRVVYPLRFGAPDGLDDWTLADWCDQCHRKGGLVIWVPGARGKSNMRFQISDFKSQISNLTSEMGCLWQGEAPADLILGKVDAVEVSPDFEFSPATLRQWYGLLNLGFRLPLVGASGKESNRGVLGAWRTYARLPPTAEFNYRKWIEAVRAGRTFVTREPLLAFTVNGQDPGAVIQLETSVQTVQAHAVSRGEGSGVRGQGERLDVSANGTVVARTPAGETGAFIDMEVHLPAGGWLAAAYWGHGDSRSGEHLLAHTSPVYVQVPGQPPPGDAETAAALVRHMDAMLAWVQSQWRFANTKQREHLDAIFQGARAKILGKG